MQAITTKFLPPTNRCDARIRVRCQAQSIIVPWDDARDVQGNHNRAAAILIDKLGWNSDEYGPWYGGTLPTGEGYAYVCGGKAIPTGPVVNGELFAPGYTRESALYEQKTRLRRGKGKAEP